MAKRKGKHGARLNGIVILLVTAVVAFCVLNTLEQKHGLGLGLPDFDLSAVDFIYDYLDGIGTQSKEHMDNALAVSGSAEALLDAKLTVHTLDVGQAESILILGPDKTVLIDAGENDQGDLVLRYLAAQGVKKIDIMIGTHPHSDHIGGMDDVLRGIPVELIILPQIPDDIIPTTKTYTDLLKAIIDTGVELEAAAPGLTYNLGDGAKLQLMGPGEVFTDLNDVSVITKLVYGKTSFLFTGDAGAPAEKSVLQNGGLHADVLNVGHHGSSTATTGEFLKAVSPRIALISCGLDNSYGHPNREVMERLQGIGAEIYRTDLQGAVVVASDGERLSVQTEK